ncbi:MAG: nitroreductase family protein [Planctomycetes bacterium]|nr:nitroreductase family protein [Planctomycetota bacterium]
MSGIIFLKSANINSTIDFYKNRIGMQLWLNQAHCTILKHGNLLLGFCEGSTSEIQGCYTFFYQSQAEIDQKHKDFADCAESEPKLNTEYNIYHFFARDPEGRLVEFQQFVEPVAPYIDGIDLLQTRRSIRKYKDTPVSDELLLKDMETCRFAPNSMNRQSYYFVIVREKDKIHKLAQVRSGAMPITKANTAVAVCVDSSKSTRVQDDGYIAAYHFLLAAHTQGLGTCWIADMDRTEVKDLLQIPHDHFVATVTPLGFPDETPVVKGRKPASDLMK